MAMFKTSILLILMALFSINADAQNDKLMEWANQGTVKNEDYNSEIPFRYVNGYIFIDIVQNDKKYNFLFDSGAEATLIDKSIVNEFEFEPFSTTDISGPLITNENVNTITLLEIKVSDVEFINIGAVAFDLQIFKSKFCDKLDGVVGSTLLKKAKWQIDYENKVIRLSNDITQLITEKPEYTLTTNLSEKGWGTETVELTVDGYASQFDFDTGNGRSKIVSQPNKIKNFTSDNKGSIIEYGLKKTAKDYKFIAKSITLGDIKLNNQIIALESEVGNYQLLGNRFFENYIVTIDWENHQVFLEPVKEILPDELFGFELDFKANYENNKIEVATGLKKFTKQNKIERGAILLKVNEIDVSNFSHQELCDFWNMEWKQITDTEKLNIVISQKGKTDELILTKKKLI
ncbi:aspartyl protease family protein [Maribacter sp. MMG018]|uniref:aspartyl protease family protein n=1 Tax=Maribacter sp. MMG018 TaxID=2822688 RepID=UPI001B387B6C|nr:aspartyl protease family protein [Maribacter sp. MMG018]MBQ4915472.1 aspartyl protease family protein [Maribacter sp. MMG018]